jgi:hypothetical protein
LQTIELLHLLHLYIRALASGGAASALGDGGVPPGDRGVTPGDANLAPGNGGVTSGDGGAFVDATNDGVAPGDGGELGGHGLARCYDLWLEATVVHLFCIACVAYYP